MTNDIISSFGIKQEDIELLTSTRKNGTLTIRIRLVNRGVRCQACGKYIRKIKDYRHHLIRNSVFISEPCVIDYSARRFLCPYCGKTTSEPNPFTDRFRNISTDTVDNVLSLLKKYNETFSSVARATQLSTTKVMQIFDTYVQPKRKKFSSSICLDEFYFSRKRRKKYAFLILDFTKGNIIDILESREKHKISSYFYSIPIEERKLVKYVSIDMNDIYRDIAKTYFPHALVCADPFHVLKHLSEMLDLVRLRVLRRYEQDKKSDEYYLLKYQKHLLFSDISDDVTAVKKNHHFRYSITDRQKLEMMLMLDEELREAYELKDSYLLFNRVDYDSKTREQVFLAIVNRMTDSGINEMVRAGNTLFHWKEEILNSFCTDCRWKKVDGKKVQIFYRVSNGPIEGRNKYIKMILKLANGYSNFERFRNRCMYSLNKFEQRSDEPVDHEVTRHFKKPRE